MKLFNLKKSAYEQYKLQVKGNTNITYEQAQKKLTRNILLAYKKKSVTNSLKLQQVYIYGYMKIVTKFGAIVEIENKTKDVVKGWTKDEKKYIELSRELGIN